MTLHLVFVALVLLGCTYFISVQRRVDFLTVGFFSAVVYFLPGIAGYTLSPVTPASPIKLPVALQPEVYLIMTVVLAVLLAGALVYDWLATWQPGAPWRLEDSGYAGHVAAVLGVIGLVLSWVESDGAAFAVDKRIVIEVVGRGHLLWEMGASLACIFGFLHRRRVIFTLGLMLIVVDMYIGFRLAFALTFLAVTVVWFSGRAPLRLAKVGARYWVPILLAGLFVILFQNLKEPLRAGDWSEIATRLSTPTWYGIAVMTSEPFTTQTILNEVVRADFRTGTEHLWSATEHLILFAPALGAEAARFNDLYQPALFPTVDHGLANNIWAQMWSAGGWTLLSGFLVVYVLLLMIGSRLLYISDPAIRAGTSLFFAYLAFYVHRNELLVQVGLQKQVLLVWLLCVGVAIIAHRALLAPATR